MNSLESMMPVDGRPKPRRRVEIILAMALLAVLLGIVLLWRSFSYRSEPAFQWLTPAEFSHTTRLTPFTGIAYKLMNLAPALWRGYLSRRPHLSISARLYALTQGAEMQIGLPAASSTNTHGERAWFLSPVELKALQQEATTNLSFRLVTQAGIQTADGLHCTVMTGTSASNPTGLTLDALPKVSPGWVRLLAAASSIENRQGSSPFSATLHTNLAAAFRVRIPNQGGLLLAAPTDKSGSETNYWILISGTAVDSTGVPIKPPARIDRP
ncbi:MAG TPA: hypothetical protein VNZ64_12925 [Candidatus Acidoferrum sp.]|nr:hypothetical protein [Candidatus Acidoferrum sp.]